MVESRVIAPAVGLFSFNSRLAGNIVARVIAPVVGQ